MPSSADNTSDAKREYNKSLLKHYSTLQMYLLRSFNKLKLDDNRCDEIVAHRGHAVCYTHESNLSNRLQLQLFQ